MELWELQAILDIELEKVEGQRDYRLIEELAGLLGVEVLEDDTTTAAETML